MRNVESDQFRIDGILYKNFMRNVRHSTNGVFEDVLAVLMDEIHLLFYRIYRSGIQAAACRHFEELPAGAIGLQNKVDNAAFVALCGFKQNSASPISKEDARRAILGINDGRHDICADDKHLSVHARRDELSARCKGIDET